MNREDVDEIDHGLFYENKPVVRLEGLSDGMGIPVQWSIDI
jgi:hypothetical protein